jgi:hypothetical protein
VDALIAPSPGRSAVVCLAALVLSPAAWGGETLRPGTYEVVVETVMPHLEENLRYATIREVRCLRSGEFASLFPVLKHDSLAGCSLRDASTRDESVRYRLICQQPDVASGSAWLRSDRDRIDGVLQVKMGGKNMTFEQRVRATRQGECP